jgi:hypothetical protein
LPFRVREADDSIFSDPIEGLLNNPYPETYTPSGRGVSSRAGARVRMSAEEAGKGRSSVGRRVLVG